MKMYLKQCMLYFKRITIPFQERNHIKSFPRMTSHYSRVDAPQKRFLSPHLNISRMYNLYLEAEQPEVLVREHERVEARQQKRPILPKIKPVVVYYDNITH